MIQRVLFIGLLVIGAGISACRKQHTSPDEPLSAYYCPMHPEVTADKPSVCPICFMDLVRRSGDPSEDLSSMLSELTLEASQQIVAQVKTMKVKQEKRDREITAYGTVNFAEPNRKTIAARFSGRVERLYVSTSGSKIQGMDVLFEAYSPEVIQAENEYLFYYQKLLTDSGNQAYQASFNGLEQRLRLMGIQDVELSDLRHRQAPHWRIPFRSSYTGWIIRKNITEGAYFREGDVLYEIDDLQILWFVAELYEKDIRFIRPGLSAEIRVYSYPQHKFSGQVILTDPALDNSTRTLKVRIQVANPDLWLRPRMNGEAKIRLPAPPAIYIPKTSVIHTGRKNIVWVRTGEKTFQPVEVTIGSASGDDYEIFNGLNEGMEIAVSGGYLIDSEAQLRGIR